MKITKRHIGNEPTRQEMAIKAAERVRTEGPLSLDTLIKLEEKYQLGYNHIVEFAGKDLAKILYVLRNYCKLNCLAALRVVEANLKDEMSIKIMAKQEKDTIIMHLCGLDWQKARDLVREIDEIDKKKNELFASSFARALANGINASCGGHAIYMDDVERAKAKGLTLSQYLFMEAFNDTYESDNFFDALTDSSANPPID